MLSSKARWKQQEADERTVGLIAEQFGVEPLIARLLAVRGFIDAEQINKFLHGGTDELHDPFLFDGMKEAVERIKLALERKERIRVYGDYDADGVSSTSLMTALLRQLGCDFDTYIPHRVREGYGLNVKAIDLAKEQGIALIITVDTGISAREQIAYANELGIDVVVTDHHEPPELLPDAVAVINPKKESCPYPFKQLAGVGVALKLSQALLGRWPEELLQYAAIGTIADLMPLVGENRLIVKQGLAMMKKAPCPGIRALLAVSGVEYQTVNETHIGFSVAPRINASGRLTSADDALRLLTTESAPEAESLAEQLDQLNKERQRIVDDMTKQAFAMLEQRSGPVPNVIVLAQEDWNVGVIGIVASKVLDKYYRPTLILGIDRETGLAKGSARSIAGYDIYQALTRCSDLMDHYGGHQAAAGMTIHRDKLDDLAERLCGLADEWLSEGDYVPIVQADMMCALNEVSVGSIKQLELLSPFGMGNPSPKFVFTGLESKDARTMGKEQQHIKLALKQAGAETSASVDAVGFSKSELLDWISPAAKIDVLGELSINEWNGTRKPQIMIQDMRITHVQSFDWRGRTRLSARLGELEARLTERGRSNDPVHVVMFGRNHAVRQIGSANAAVWGADPAGNLIPLNEAASRCHIRSAKDIVLGMLPDRLSEVTAVVRQAGQAERFYAAFSDQEAGDSSVIPSRDMFKLVYGSIMKDGGHPLPRLMQIIAKRSGLSENMIRFMINVFEELEFVRRTGDTVAAVPAPAKKDLTVSQSYQLRQHKAEVEQQLVYSTAKELSEWICSQHQLSDRVEDVI